MTALNLPQAKLFVMNTGIYSITCRVNNKMYIGCSDKIKGRFTYHKWALNMKRGISKSNRGGQNRIGNKENYMCIWSYENITKANKVTEKVEI